MNFVYCNPLYLESGHFFLYFCLSEIKWDVPGEEILPQPQAMAVTMCCSMSFQADWLLLLAIDRCYVCFKLFSHLYSLSGNGQTGTWEDKLKLGNPFTDLESKADRIPRSQQSKIHTWLHRFDSCDFFPPQDGTSQRTLGNNDKAALTWWRGEMPCCGWPDGNGNNRQINSANKTYG